MVIALRRGVDYVPTGLYDPAAKKPDGTTNRFGQEDLVVKYKLTSINPNDTNIYKNPVRVVAGSYPTGMDPMQSKDTKYCVVHDNGEVYILDDYNPFNKTYTIDGQDPNGSPSYGQQYSVYPVCQSKTGRSIRRFEYTDTLRHCWYPECMIRPIGYTYNSAKIHLYPSGTSNVPFTYYYYDSAKGIEVESTGLQYLWRTDPTDYRTIWNKALILETAGFHQLFFEGEKFSFINAPTTGSADDLAPFGTVIDAGAYNNIIIESQTTLERAVYKQVGGSAVGTFWNSSRLMNIFGTVSFGQYPWFLVTALDGLLIDSTGQRYDYLRRSGQDWLYLVASRLPNNGEINLAAVSGLRFITIQEVALSNPITISFTKDIPGSGTTTTLYKGVDYVPTGIYDGSKFKNDLVVRCKIGGVYYKYPVLKATRCTSVYCINHTDPTTNKQVLYILDGFDPFDKYYWVWPQNRAFYGEGNYGHDDIRARKNDRLIARYSGMFPALFAPPGYSYEPGPGTAGSLDSFLANGMGGIDTAAAGNYYYTTTAGTKTEFTHFHFDDTGEPVTYLNSVFLYQPSSVRSGKMKMQPMNYHRLLIDGEKCNFIAAQPDLFDRALPNYPLLTDFGSYQSKTFSAGWSTLPINNALVGGDAPLPNRSYRPALYSSMNLELSWSVKVVGFQQREHMYMCAYTSLWDRCIIPSNSGSYADSNGNRYDYLQLANRAGLYVPVESATSMLLMSQINLDSDGLLVRRIVDNIPSVDLISWLQAQLTTDPAIVDGLKAQLNSAATALNTARATVAAYLSDPTALDAQIDALNAQATIATDNAIKDLLNAQVAILRQIQVVQNTLNTKSLGLDASQAQVATILALLSSATTLVGANISDPTVLQAHIDGLQSQILPLPDGLEAKTALKTQLGILQQIQAVQRVLKDTSISLTAAQDQIIAVTAAVNLAEAAATSNLSDPSVVQAQIDVLTAQVGATTDATVQDLLNAQIGILRQIQTVQSNLSDQTTNLDAAQTQVATILGLLSSATASLTSDISNPTVLQEQINQLQSQIDTTTDMIAKGALSTQLDILQQIQSVQRALEDKSISLTAAQDQIIAVTATLDNAQAQVAENLSNPAALDGQISAIQVQLSNTTDTTTKNLLNAQLKILTQIRDTQTSLKESKVDLNDAQAQVLSVISALSGSSTGQVGSIQDQIAALQEQIAATTDPNAKTTLDTQLNILQHVQSADLAITQANTSSAVARAGIVSFVNNMNSARLQVKENLGDVTVLKDEIEALQAQLAQTTDQDIQASLRAQIDILSQIRDIQQTLQQQTVSPSLLERIRNLGWSRILWIGMGIVLSTILFAVYMRGEGGWTGKISGKVGSFLGVMRGRRNA